MNFLYNFCNHPVYRETDRRTDKPRQTHNLIGERNSKTKDKDLVVMNGIIQNTYKKRENNGITGRQTDKQTNKQTNNLTLTLNWLRYVLTAIWIPCSDILATVTKTETITERIFITMTKL